MTTDYFNLPEGVEDILSERALELESLRRSLIDLYSKKGFNLVYPSIIEYADSIGAVSYTHLTLPTMFEV